MILIWRGSYRMRPMSATLPEDAIAEERRNSSRGNFSRRGGKQCPKIVTKNPSPIVGTS
jgi:hypothetical protein